MAGSLPVWFGVYLCSPVWHKVIGVVQVITGLGFSGLFAMCLLWFDSGLVL